MGKNHKRGMSISGTVTGSGTGRVFTFANEVSPCWYTNTHATAVAFVRLNGTVDGDSSTAHGGHDIRVGPGATQELTVDGLIGIKSLSVEYSADPGTSYSVTGMPIKQM